MAFYVGSRMVGRCLLNREMTFMQNLGDMPTAALETFGSTGTFGHGTITGAPGAQSHLATELFKKMTGVDMMGVPYKGQGPAMIGLIGGETQLTFSTLVQAIPYIKSEKLRGIAVTSTEHASAYPSLPTVAATVPGYESGAKYAMVAPPKTPAAIINRLNLEIVRVLHSAEVKDKLVKAGAESIGSSPKELAAAMQLEMTQLGKLIKDAGVRAD